MLFSAALALTPAQQQEDFDLFWAEAEHHPALTLYTPRAELEAAKAATRAQLEVEHDAVTFWGILAQSASLIGCGHSGLYPSYAVLNALPSGTGPFPLDLVVIEDKLYLDPRSIPEAGEVRSIQGMPAEELLAKLRNMTNADGRSTPTQDHQIDGSAWYMVPAVVGPSFDYAVEIERDGVEHTLSVSWHDRTDIHAGEPEAEARIERVPTATGFVVRASFDEFKSRGHTRRTVTKPILKAVKQGAEGVILDLRHNGGGSWPAAADLVAHFHPDPWPTYSARLITRALAERRGWSAERIASRLTDEGLVDMGYGEDAIWQPRFPQIEVPLVVMTASPTFSTAADVAGFVKREGMGHVVGTPSGGSARFQTSQVSRSGVLPHSGLEWDINLHRSDLADPDGALKDGVGAVPDVFVERSIEDVRLERDPALAAALLDIATRQTD